jgi:ABC-type lipoprotein export system ATPase subunit
LRQTYSGFGWDFNVTELLVLAEHLSKHFVTGISTVTAVKSVSLSVEAGEFVAIEGRSGSGKSTLLHLLGLLMSPDEGRYRLKGRNVARLRDDDRAAIRSRQIGFVFQLPVLLARASALENVELPLTYAGVGAAERHRRARRALEDGLGHRLNHLPNHLSGSSNSA